MAVLMLLLGLIGPLRGQEEVVLLDEVVARVNQEVITLTDLLREERILKGGLEQGLQDQQQAEEQFQRRRKNVLQTMIQNRMLVQRAEELGMTSDIDRDVVKAIEEMRKEAGIPSVEVLDQYLRQQGSSLDEYRKSFKERMIIDTLIQQFVYSRITLLTPEIEKFYQENIERFTESARVGLKEILFLSEGRDPAEVREEAEEVLRKLRAGASFEEMARIHSDGPTAQSGGDIGEFKRGSMDPVLENAAFQLEEGQISGILETDYGLVLIQVTQKTPPVQKSLEEVRPQITQEMYRIKAEPELKEFMNDVREQTYVYVAPKYQELYDVSELGRLN